MRKTLKEKFLVSSLIALALAFQSGCGQPGTLKSQLKLASLTPYAEQSYSEQLVFGDYACDSQDNIIPFDSAMGAGHFRACPSQTNSSKVLVRGTTNYNSVICAFPYQYVDATHVYLKPGANGLPMYNCKDITQGDGAEFEFQYTNFNGLYVVELSKLPQMKTCANYNNLVDCDEFYSFGQFR